MTRGNRSGWEVSCTQTSAAARTIRERDGSGRGNQVAFINTASNEVSAMLPVGNRAWGIALSPDGSRLYTANGGAASNDISVIDVQARKEITRVKVGDGPWGIAVGPRP